MPGSCFQAYTPTPAIQHSESTSQSRSKRHASSSSFPSGDHPPRQLFANAAIAASRVLAPRSRRNASVQRKRPIPSANSWRAPLLPPPASARNRATRALLWLLSARSPTSRGALPPDCVEAEDAPHHDAIFQHVVVVVAPLPRR